MEQFLWNSCKRKIKKILLQKDLSMIGQRYIPQSVKGDLAKRIAQTLPPKDTSKKEVSRTLFPDKTEVKAK